MTNQQYRTVHLRESEWRALHRLRIDSGHRSLTAALGAVLTELAQLRERLGQNTDPAAPSRAHFAEGNDP
jgi:hypothetical protein